MRTRRLYEKHPVYRRIDRKLFLRTERVSLVNSLEKARVFDARETALLRDRQVELPQKLFLVAAKNAGLVNEIARIEKGFSNPEREQILNAGFEAIAEITGISTEFLKEAHKKIEWTPKTVQELTAGEARLEHAIKKSIKTVSPEERKKLLELVSKRLSHNLLIQGASLRIFYQAIPFMKNTLERIRPGLTGKYIGFSATLQLLNLLYKGKFPGQLAVSAGKSKLSISPERKFEITIQGINFPSLFNELTKATYEALLHEGMPTREELGKHEKTFRRLTSGPRLEFEEHKVSPQASLKMHQALAGVASGENFRTIKRILKENGYEEVSPEFAVSMLYKSFSKLSPRMTSYFFARAVQGKFSKADENRLFKKLLQNLRGV